MPIALVMAVDWDTVMAAGVMRIRMRGVVHHGVAIVRGQAVRVLTRWRILLI